MPNDDTPLRPAAEVRRGFTRQSELSCTLYELTCARCSRILGNRRGRWSGEPRREVRTVCPDCRARTADALGPPEPVEPDWALALRACAVMVAFVAFALWLRWWGG